MNKIYKTIDDLKNQIKGYGIKLKHNEKIVVLQPLKKYAKEYTDGDMEKALIDLSKWFGLVGHIDNGKVTMSIREDEKQNE